MITASACRGNLLQPICANTKSPAHRWFCFQNLVDARAALLPGHSGPAVRQLRKSSPVWKARSSFLRNLPCSHDVERPKLTAKPCLLATLGAGGIPDQHQQPNDDGFHVLHEKTCQRVDHKLYRDGIPRSGPLSETAALCLSERARGRSSATTN